MKIKPKSINVTSNKKETAEEKLQMPPSGYNIANKMRVIIGSIEMKAIMINKMLSKGEQHIFEKKKVLTFDTPEYESLCEMLNSLKVLSAQGVKTADDILLLLDYQASA